MQGQVVTVGLVVGMCVTLAAFTALADDSDKQKEPSAGEREGIPLAEVRMERAIDIEQMKAGAAERFAKVDADGNGKVTPEEFAAAHGDAPKADRRKAMRKRMERRMRDRRDEMRRNMRGMLGDEAFEVADGDGDGKLSREEVRGLPKAARSVAQRRAFDRVDADGDGVLTASELSPRVAMLEKADADGDGKVNREEMRALRKAHASGDGKKRRGWHKVRKSGDTDADKTE